MLIGSEYNPLVSIVMPAYNSERFIAEAIDSVLAQSYDNWELIIIDDASTDNTADIIQEYSDSRIHYYKTTRLGRPSAVRNRARTLCNGQLIMFFDSDDILSTDTVKIYIEALHSCKQTAVYGFVKHINEHGQPIAAAGYKLLSDGNGGYIVPKTYKHTWKRIATCQIVATANLMVRREALERVDWFDEDMPSAEDMHLYLKLFLDKQDGVIFVPHYVILYRQNEKSLTRKKDNIENLLQGHLQALDRFFSYPQAPKEIQKWYSAAYARRYNYVAGICLGQGYKAMAIDIVIRAWKDRRVHWMDWLCNCPSSILRCLLPREWDMVAKQLAVQLRDGIILQRVKQTISIGNI